jgi:HK97 gp10 family phage protein
MPRNASVERFRLLTEDLKKEVHAQAVQELNTQALGLAQAIESVAPIYQGPPVGGVVPGALKHSVRVVQDRSKDTVVRVVAGGALTIRPSVSGNPYDYARGDEFGTHNMRAQPFFFPTYRLMKKKMIAAMKRKITASIKKRSAE